MEKNNNIGYFGTDLERHGHYLWSISDDGKRMYSSNLNFQAIPFDPETLAYVNGRNAHLPKGTVQFYSIEGYVICYIEGSCVDKRPGTKTVFWIKGNITYSQMKDIIVSLPIAQAMFEKMEFDVKWPELIENKGIKKEPTYPTIC